MATSDYYRVPIRSDVVWCTWTDATASSTTASYTTHDVWENWNTSGTDYTYTYSSDTSADTAWGIWVSSNPKVIDYSYYRAEEIRLPEKTVEQKRAERVQHDINKLWGDIRIMEEHRRKEQAELTAQSLLEDLISKEDLEYYRETGRLLVKGRKYDYVIFKDAGVYRVDKDKIHDLCIHLKKQYGFPKTDNVISLKLLIEANEKEFLKTANNHGEVKTENTIEKVLEVAKRAA